MKIRTIKREELRQFLAVKAGIEVSDELRHTLLSHLRWAKELYVFEAKTTLPWVPGKNSLWSQVKSTGVHIGDIEGHIGVTCLNVHVFNTLEAAQLVAGACETAADISERWKETYPDSAKWIPIMTAKQAPSPGYSWEEYENFLKRKVIEGMGVPAEYLNHTRQPLVPPFMDESTITGRRGTTPEQVSQKALPAHTDSIKGFYQDMVKAPPDGLSIHDKKLIEHKTASRIVGDSPMSHKDVRQALLHRWAPIPCDCVSEDGQLQFPFRLQPSERWHSACRCGRTTRVGAYGSPAEADMAWNNMMARKFSAIDCSCGHKLLVHEVAVIGPPSGPFFYRCDCGMESPSRTDLMGAYYAAKVWLKPMTRHEPDWMILTADEVLHLIIEEQGHTTLPCPVCALREGISRIPNSRERGDGKWRSECPVCKNGGGWKKYHLPAVKDWNELASHEFARPTCCCGKYVELRKYNYAYQYVCTCGVKTLHEALLLAAHKKLGEMLHF